MFVLCPMSNCGSPQKRDRFLECLSKIAPVTLEAETECQAYAWFRSAEDNDAVPCQWMQGLEAYETAEANTVTHRASAPYKAFRAAVAEDGLLERPSDLRFWRPTGIGFHSRPGTVNLMRESSNPQYVVVNELTPAMGMKNQALEQLQRIARLAMDSASTKSFWVLDRGEDSQDENLFIFSMFETKTNAEAFEDGDAKRIWQHLEEICKQTTRTTWVECGIGFIGRL